MYSSLDIKKSKKKKKYLVIVQLYSSILGFHLAACVINFHPEHLFYIDINKHIICYFKTLKMLFVILFLISCKKMKFPLVRIHFGKRIDGKWWVGVRLDRRDR